MAIDNPSVNSAIASYASPRVLRMPSDPPGLKGPEIISEGMGPEKMTFAWKNKNKMCDYDGQSVVVDTCVQVCARARVCGMDSACVLC